MHMSPDLVGYIASGLVLLTFTAKSMRALRILAIFRNLAFIIYGFVEAIIPVLCLHAILLPLNVTRLVQLPRDAKRTPARRLGRRAVSACSIAVSRWSAQLLSWPLMNQSRAKLIGRVDSK